MASNSIMDYLKNVGQSVKFAAIESVSEKMPNLSKVFSENNKKYVQEVYKDISQNKQKMSMVERIRNNTVYRQVATGWANAKESLKTGKFYDENRSTGQSLEEMMAGLNDLLESLGGNSDMIEAEMNGEEVGSTNEHRVHGIPEVTRGDALVATASAQSSRRAANAISATIVKTAELSDLTIRKSANLQLRALQEQANLLSNGFKQLSSSLHTINQFNSQVVLTHAQNSRMFFEQATYLAQERNAILNRILEMQEDTYAATMHNTSQQDKIDATKFEKIFKDGGFDLRAYINLLGSKGKGSPLGQLFSFVKLLPMAIGQVVQNPIHFLAKAGIDMMIDNSLKRVMSNIDNSISGFISTGLTKLFNWGSDRANKDTFLGQLARFFGVKQENTHLGAVDTSKYNKEAMQWNGIAQKALVEVIPGHLRRIEASLTGEGERAFDFAKGAWSTMKQVARAEKDYDKDMYKGVFEPLVKEIRNVTRYYDYNREDQRAMNAKLEAFLKGVANRGTIDFEHINQYREEYGDDEDFIKKLQLLLGSGMINKTTQMNLAGRINQAHSNKAKYISGINPSDQSLINEFTNNSYREKWAKGIGTGALTSPMANLTILKDERNMTLYDYQYNILKTLQSMSFGSGGKRGKKGGNPPAGGSPFTPIDQLIEQRKEQRKMSLKERYGGDSEAAIRDYQRGYLYDDEIEELERWIEAEQSVAVARFKANKKIKTYNEDKSYLKDDEKMDILHSDGMEFTKNVAKNSQVQEERRNASFTKEGSTFGELDKTLKGLGLDIHDKDSVLGSILNAETIADKFNAVTDAMSSLTKTPQTILTSIFTEVDRFMYDFLFNKVDEGMEGEKDDQGNPIKGFFGKVTHEFSKTMENLNAKFNKWFADTFKNGAKGLGGMFKDIASEYFGIDIDAKVKQAKNKFKAYKAKTRAGIMQAGKALFNEVGDSLKGTWNDITGQEQEEVNPDQEAIDKSIARHKRKEKKRKQQDAPETAVSGIRKYDTRFGLGIVGPGEKIISPGRGKILDNTTGYKAYTLQYGDSVIPSYLNPSNAGRSRITPQSLASQEYNEKALQKKFMDGGAIPLGTFSTGGDIVPADDPADDDQENKGKFNFNFGFSDFISKIIGKDPKKAVSDYEKTLSKNLPDLVKNGMIGAVTGGVLLGGPLFGALMGAGLTVVQKSSTVQDYLFGKELVDAKGNKTGERDDSGLISKKVLKMVDKYAPDAKKYGITGALAGMITPFGPFGGMMIGAGLSFLKNNEKAYNFLFGDEGGLLNKDRKARIKKALPNIGMATLGTLFLGPFGIMGNAILGAGLGMLSTTESFKRLVLGAKDRNGVRRGGLADVIRRQITDPFKRMMDDSKKRMAKWFKEDLFKPVANTLKPLGRTIVGTIKDTLRNLAKEAFGKTGEGNGSFLRKMGLKKLDQMLTAVRNAGGIVPAVGAFVGNRIGDVAHAAEENIGKWAERRNYRKGYFEEGTTSDQRRARAKELGIDINDEKQYRLGKIDQSLSNIKDVNQLKEMLGAIQGLQNTKEDAEFELNRSIAGEKDHMISTTQKLYDEYMAKNPGEKDWNTLYRNMEDVRDKILDLNMQKNFDPNDKKSKGQIAQIIADAKLPKELQKQMFDLANDVGSSIAIYQGNKKQLGQAFTADNPLVQKAAQFFNLDPVNDIERIQENLKDPHLVDLLQTEIGARTEENAALTVTEEDKIKKALPPGEKMLVQKEEEQITELQILNKAVQHICDIIIEKNPNKRKKKNQKFFDELKETGNKYGTSDDIKKAIFEAANYVQNTDVQQDVNESQVGQAATEHGAEYYDEVFDSKWANEHDEKFKAAKEKWIKENYKYLPVHLKTEDEKNEYIKNNIEEDIWKQAHGKTFTGRIKNSISEHVQALPETMSELGSSAYELGARMGQGLLNFFNIPEIIKDNGYTYTPSSNAVDPMAMKIAKEQADKNIPPTATYGLPFYGTFAAGAAVAGAAKGASTATAATNGGGFLSNLASKIAPGLFGGANNNQQQEQPSNNIKEVQQSAPSAGEVKSTAGMVAQFDHSKANGGAPDINTKDNVSYTSDSEGNPVALIKGPDGTPMKVKNKDNAELEKKHAAEFSFKERSANALEAIANKLGAGAKTVGKAAAAASGGLLGGLLDSIGGLINTLFLGLPVGTWLLMQLKKLPGKIWKLFTGKYNIIEKLTKLPQTIAEKFTAFKTYLKDLPGKIMEKVTKAYNGAKNLVSSVAKGFKNIGGTIIKGLMKHKKIAGAVAAVSWLASKFGFDTEDAEASEKEDQDNENTSTTDTSEDTKKTTEDKKSDSGEIKTGTESADTTEDKELDNSNAIHKEQNKRKNIDTKDPYNNINDKGVFGGEAVSAAVTTGFHLKDEYKKAKFATGSEKVSTNLKHMADETKDKIKNVASNPKGAVKEGIALAQGKIRSFLQSIVSFVGKWFPGRAAGEAVNKFCQTLIERLSGPRVEQAMAKALARQASAAAAGAASMGIGSAVLSAGFVIGSFISAFNNAASMFKIPEPSCTMGMKIIAGLVNAVHCALTMIPIIGLAIAIFIDSKDLLKIAIKIIGPVVGLSEDNLRQLQQGGDKIVSNNVKAAEQAAKDNPDLNPGQGKNGQESSYFDDAKAVASGAWEGFKNVVSSGASWIGNKVSSGVSWVGNKASEFGSWVKNKVSGKGKHSTYGRGRRGLFGTGFHSQLDPAIAGMGFNIPGDTEKQTVKDSACGPMAMANALESVGVSVDDKDIIDKTKVGKEKNGGTPDYVLNKYANNQGISTKTVGTSEKDLANSLKSGKPLVLMGQNNMGETDKDPFAENPHYVTATGLDKDGNVIIKDPESYQPVKTYKLRDIAQKTTIATELSKDKEPKFSEGASLKEIMAWKLKHAGRSKWGREKSNGTGEDIYAYLKTKGLSNQAISGIMGNWYAESKWKSSLVECKKPPWREISSDTMTIDGNTGYGLAQWTYITRQQKLHEFMKSKGLQDSDYKGQIDFVFSGQDGDIRPVIKSMDKMNPEEAAREFLDKYEQKILDTKNTERYHLSERQKAAREVFEKQGKGMSGVSSLTGSSSGSSSNISTDVQDEEEQGIFGAIAQLAKKLGSIINIFGDGSSGSSSGGSSSGGGIGGANVKEIADKIIKMANAYANSPITYGMTNPVAVPPAKGSCDCSGMAMSCYKAGGIDITRTADTQYEFFKKHNAIYKGDMHQLQPADLVFTRNSSGRIDHVFVYIGNGKAVNMGQNHRERGNLAGLNSAGGDAVYYNGWATIKAGIDYHKGGAEFGSLTKLCSALGLGSSSSGGYHGGDKRSKTTRIIVHHTSGSKTSDPDPSAAEINKWHTAPPRNWNCIGYHYVIRKNGSIEKGRNEDEIGAHAEGANSDSIGIHVGGEFMYFKPTEKQIESLIKLIQQLCKKYNIPIDRKHILGHREVGQTDCPGDNLYNQLDSIVAKAAGSGKGKSRWGTGKPNVPDILKDHPKFGRGKSKYGKGANDYKFSVPKTNYTVQHGGSGGTFSNSSNKPFFNNDSLTKYANATMKGETYQKYQDPITGKLLTAKDMEIAQKAGVTKNVKKEDIKSLEEWNKAKEEGREVQVSAPENSVIDMAEQGQQQTSQTNLMDQFFGGVGSKLDAISEKLAPIKSALFSKLGSVISEKFGKFSNLIGDPLGMFKGFFGSKDNSSSSSSSADSSNGGGGGTFNGDATAIPTTGSATAALKKALNCEITSPYGEPRDSRSGKHNGIDYGIGTGTPVPTVTDGVIDDINTQGGPGTGYGKFVVVKDKKGMYHIYAHLSQNNLAKKGDSVKAGQIIAKSGNTGHSSGPHLHYGIYNNPNCAEDKGVINPNTYDVTGLSESGKGKYGRGRLIKINPVKTKGTDRGGEETKKYVPKSGKGKFKSTGLEDLDITRTAIYPDFPKDIKSPDNTFGVTDEMIKQSKFGQGKYGKGFDLNSVLNVLGSIAQFANLNRNPFIVGGGFAGNNAQQKPQNNVKQAQNKKKEVDKKLIGPNGLQYTQNDIDYILKNPNLFGGAKTIDDAIKILSKDKRYTEKSKDTKKEENKKLIAPNGMKYTQNDIDYILKNADKFGGAKTIDDAIKILSKDKRYTEKSKDTKKEEKKTATQEQKEAALKEYQRQVEQFKNIPVAQQRVMAQMGIIPKMPDILKEESEQEQTKEKENNKDKSILEKQKEKAKSITKEKKDLGPFGGFANSIDKLEEIFSSFFGKKKKSTKKDEKKTGSEAINKAQKEAKEAKKAEASIDNKINEKDIQAKKNKYKEYFDKINDDTPIEDVKEMIKDIPKDGISKDNIIDWDNDDKVVIRAKAKAQLKAYNIKLEKDAKKKANENKTKNEEIKKDQNSITKAQDDSKFNLGQEGSHGEGPNGKKYTNNDIAYILKNSDKFGGVKTVEDAIKILEKDKRYTEKSEEAKKDDKPSPDSTDPGKTEKGETKENKKSKDGVTTPTQESSQKPSQAVSAQDKLDMLIEAQNKTNELLSAILNMAAKAMSIKESDIKTAEKTAKANNKKINETSAMTKLNYFYNNSMKNSGVDTSFFNPDSGDFIDISKRMQKIASM